ncbi:MAG: hypothetical protein WC213_13515 [Arenimonas sp.]|jgi:hypothetical protein
MNPDQPNSQLRSRLTLLLIAAMFLSSFFIAAFLRFSGWTPDRGKNYGELLQPPKDLSALTLVRADGGAYAWAPEKNLWRIVVVPDKDCTTACVTLLDALHRVWQNQGRRADRIDVLWFGDLPADGPRFRRLIPMQPNAALSAALPEAARADALPVYLIDPSGFLALHYRAGFEPTGLRKDLGKLVK